MTITNIKTHSRTRLEQPALCRESLGEAVAASRKHAWTPVVRKTVPATEYVLVGMPAEWQIHAIQTGQAADPWHSLPEPICGALTFLFLTRATTATAGLETRDFPEPAKLASVRGIERLEATAELKSPTEVERELDFYAQPEPESVRKIKVKITRRSRPEPNPILD